MTFTPPDPDLTRERLRELAERDHKCRSCLYWWWGPGFRGVCRHPDHPCWDGARLTTAALGCAHRVSLYAKQGAQDPIPVAPVDFFDHCERLAQERLAARRASQR